jgi:multiple sugar transport system permease protein
MRRRWLLRVGVSVAVLIAAAWTLFPMYWMLATAVRPTAEVFAVPLSFWPAQVTLQNFVNITQGTSPIGRFFLNSLITASVTAFLTVIVALPAGYAFARLRFRLSGTLFVVFLVTQMIPLVLLILPIYDVFLRLRLLDSYLGLVIAYTAFTVPFGVWMMWGFCLSVPQEIEEAAMVDGASLLTTLRRIVAPALAPAMVAVGGFAFLDSWNNLLFPLVLTSKYDMKTLAPGLLFAYSGEYRDDWGGIMAASLVTALPVILGFAFLQRYMTRGLEGAVTG